MFRTIIFALLFLVANTASAWFPQFVHAPGARYKFNKQYYSGGSEAQMAWVGYVVDYEDIEPIDCRVVVEARISQYDTEPEQIWISNTATQYGSGWYSSHTITTSLGATASVCKHWDFYIEYNTPGGWSREGSYQAHIWIPTNDDEPISNWATIHSESLAVIKANTVEFELFLYGDVEEYGGGSYTLEIYHAKLDSGGNPITDEWVLLTTAGSTQWIYDGSEYETFRYSTPSRNGTNTLSYIEPGSIDMKLVLKRNGAIEDSFTTLMFVEAE